MTKKSLREAADRIRKAVASQYAKGVLIQANTYGVFRMVKGRWALTEYTPSSTYKRGCCPIGALLLEEQPESDVGASCCTVAADLLRVPVQWISNVVAGFDDGGTMSDNKSDDGVAFALGCELRVKYIKEVVR